MSQQMLQGLLIIILYASLTKTSPNKYNMNNQAPREEAIGETEYIRYTQYSLQIKYTTSEIRDTGQQEIYDQSQVLPGGEEINYNMGKDKGGKGSAQEGNLLTDSIVRMEDHLKNSIVKCESSEIGDEKEKEPEDGEALKNNFSTTPDHFTVSRVCKVNNAQQYESVRSDNFPIKEIYYQPVQIELPNAQKKKQQEKKLMQEAILPCTFVSTVKPFPQAQPEAFETKKEPQQEAKNINTNQVSRVSEDKTKIITDVLLEKINQLQNKVKILEEEKKRNEEFIKTASEYQSTPQIPAYGSIKKNNDIVKKFSTVTETQETNNQFRVRSIGSRSQSTSDNKIHSNIYSLTLIQNKGSSNIKEELQLLKKKLHSLQNSHNFTDQSLKNNIREHNFKIFENKPQEKLFSPNRKELGGKIVRRTSSKISQSPQNTFRTQTEESIEADADKGFIRTGPVKFTPGQESKTIENSMYSNVLQHEGSDLKKKQDSSAIFRKNPGPAIIQKRNFDLDNFTKSNTLQFNSDREKYVVLDSRETESMVAKTESISPVLSTYNSDIYIPDLNPSPIPQSSSEELIEIGKLTFKKLGSQITENTILNVKKFKNCVLFIIGPQENILWHYDGRFYFGGWKTFANGEGEKFGKGIQYVPGKYKYRGSFQDGKRSGYGTMIGQNGSVYMGQWYDGAKQGKGRLFEADGTTYEGDWKSGKKSGNGKLLYKGKLQFEGNFVSGLKNGLGKQYFQNGDYYQGQYLDNKFDGRGSYLWASKAQYIGEFKDGKRHGHGVWRSGDKNYDTYEGEYLEDNKNGYGVYKWANGAVYKGSFKNDLKHGEGSITYENGKTVHMVWNNGAVQKTLTSSQFFQQKESKNFNQSHHSNANMASAPKNKLKKSASSRSNQNLQSAKSLKSDRSLPKGVNIRKQPQMVQSSPKASPKVQFRTKMNNGDLLKAKINLEPHSHRPIFSKQPQAGPIKDPPYRGMQTSSNINMNV